MISDLRALLARGGVDDPGAEELADILWLAQRVLPPGRPSGSSGDPTGAGPHPPAAEGTAGEAPEEPSGRPDWEDSASGQDALGVHATGTGPRDGTDGGACTSGTPVRVPAAASLPHALALIRSLKPLTRKVPSRTAFQLDEEATVTRLVDEDVLLPVLRPEPSRWLRLTLVVDCGPSMSLWQDEVHEIQRELARLGAFRDIRRWNLLPSTDGSAVELRPHPAAHRPPRHPREIADPAGDQLILVLSDTVGGMWRTGAAHHLLTGWAGRAQVALAHLLPADLWNRVGIAPAPTRMHIPRPGLPNARWKVVSPTVPPDHHGDRHRLRQGAAVVPVPVIDLEPRSVRAWAEMTAGNGRWTSAAALLLAPARPPARRPPGRPVATPAEVSPEVAIRRFRASSSPGAWRLAGLLSALPTVTVPMARLVQQALLPGSSRSDLAEVFLGGLLRRTTGPEGRTADGELRFEFSPQTRDALLAAQYRTDVEEVRDLLRTRLTEYLRPRYGHPRSIRAALTGVSPRGVTVEAEGAAFARASRADMSRMGAPHAPAEPRTEPDAPGAADSAKVHISYAAQDRMWAEWVAWQLERAGYGAGLRLLRAGEFQDPGTATGRADAVAALLSRDYVSVAGGKGRTAAVVAAGAPYVPLLVEPVDVPEPPARSVGTVLHGLDEPAAVRALLRAVGDACGPPRTAAPRAHGKRPPPRLPHGGSLPRVWNVRRRDPDFSGREELIDHLRDTLTVGSPVAIQALHGMGGVGKTQVAVEYAHRFAEQYDIVWWVDAGQPEHLPVQFGELATRLGIADPGREVEWNAGAALAHLAGTERWLVVLDDANDPQACAGMLPAGPGHVLITSRNPQWQGLVSTIGLDVFSRADARRYLTTRLPALTGDEADTLARELGDLPLALAQAAGVIGAGMPAQQYLGILSRTTTALLNEGAVPAYPTSLAATVALAREGLAAYHPGAAALLSLGSFFGPGPIPVDWLEGARGLLRTVPATAGAHWPQHALQPLARYGLARIDGGTLQIHRLTQTIVRDRTGEAEAAAVRSDVVTVLAEVSPGDPDLPESWDSWALLTSHLLTRPDSPEDLQALGRVLAGAAHYLLASGQVGEALIMSRECHASWARTMGADHPETLVWAQYSALATADAGDTAEARTLIGEVLARRRRVLGEDHPDTLTSADTLARILGHLGELVAARELAEDVVVRRRRVLGEDHSATLASGNTLAEILMRLGELVAARELAEDVLARLRRLLGEDHPRTLRTAHNLAVALARLHEPVPARELAEDVLARSRRVVGDDHPDTLTAMEGLAVTLHDLGEYTEARRLHEHVLGSRRRVMGEDHPATLASARNLATVLYRLHDHQSAEALLQDVLARSMRVLGAGHPETKAVVGLLATVLTTMGKAYQAQRLLAGHADSRSSGKRRRGR
ncbi:FxSxx-COOH system tetratricopeptide repeat protein [Streptomyces glaucescens]|uniref:FxSxx-COOH system tetratricopeptide repeat protein n=1 Tax=Streptomyces glaucescens TaxID=1907 RepID=UPI00344EAB18